MHRPAWIAAPILLLAACDPTEHLAPPAEAATSAAVAAPPAPPAPESITTGLCAGKTPDSHVCDGSTLVHCDDLSGKTSVVLGCDALSRCDAEKALCVPRCPSGEVYVPPTGPEGFTMGAKDLGSRGKPHTVIVTEPFCMDATETTVAAYKACVETEGCTPPRAELRWSTYPDKPDFPVNKVDWHQSKYFCEQHGKTLPTEAQWEWAATGGDGRKWPWGNEEPTCDHADFIPGAFPYNPACEGAPKGYRRCNGAPDAGCGGGGPSAVASHPKGDRVWPSGTIHDLAGNLWEWVLDTQEPYKPGSTETDPVHLTRIEAVHGVRGGGWNRSGRGIQSAYRGGAVWDYQVSGLGFRCVRNVPDAKVAVPKSPPPPKTHRQSP